MEAIVRAIAQHNANCPFPPHTITMAPFEFERMGWEEGDTIAGLKLEADPDLGTGMFHLLCDGVDPPELEIDEGESVDADSVERERVRA